MGKITFTNSLGDVIELLGEDGDYILNSIEGLGDADVDIQTQTAPNMHGSVANNIQIQSKEIDLGFTVTGDNPREISARRSYAGQVFNPSLGRGVLVYEIEPGLSYSITCIPSNVPDYPTGRGQRGVDFQRATISLLAENPFWTDEVEREIRLFAFNSGFSFPFSFPLQFGEQGVSETIYNTGHEPAPFVAEVMGPNTRPRIKNETTGQYMEFDRVLAVGETLIVSTKRGEKYARIVTETGETSNAMKYLTFESELFSLQIGENKISYNAANGTTETSAIIRWNQLYNSI